MCRSSIESPAEKSAGILFEEHPGRQRENDPERHRPERDACLIAFVRAVYDPAIRLYPCRLAYPVDTG
jgi:hypothetical protein